jgi:hypothetical protein
MNDHLDRWLYSPDELAFARYRFPKSYVLKGTKMKKWIDQGRTPLTLIRSIFTDKVQLKFANSNELPPFKTIPFTEQDVEDNFQNPNIDIVKPHLQHNPNEIYKNTEEPWKNINPNNKWEKLAKSLSSLESNVFKIDQRNGEWGMEQLETFDNLQVGHQMRKKLRDD